MDYKTKYIKYKTKYINLIKQKAGVQSETLHNNWSNISAPWTVFVLIEV